MRKSRILRLFLVFLIITTILPVGTAQKSSAACGGTNFALFSYASWTGINGGQISGFDGELCSSSSNNSYLALRTTSGIWSGSLSWSACSGVSGQTNYAASSSTPGQGSDRMRALGTSYIAVRMCGGNVNITGFPSITGASGSVTIQLFAISGSGTPGNSNMITSNPVGNDGLTVTASPISVVTYIVAYNGNGSTSGTVPSNQTKTNGMPLTLVNTQGSLLRTGYTFTGWNTAANGSGTSYAVSASYTANAAATLYAQWSVSSLTVTYNSQGGSSITSGSTTSGGSIASSPGTPSRAGYIFDGWFTASSGGSAITFPYTHGQAANFSLYAQWSVNAPSATATTDTLGSISVSWTASADAVSYRLKLYSSSNVLITTITSLSGPTYTFSNSADLLISDGTVYKVSINVVDAIISNNYVNESSLVSVTTNILISYSASGASGSAPTSPTTVAYGGTFTTPSNTYSVPAGYSFGGWSDGSTTYAAGTTYPSSGSISGNVTLSAVWTGITSAITIAIVTGGSGLASPTSVTYPATTSLSATASTGYTFTSWSCTNGTLANSASASTTLSNVTAASTCTPTFTLNTYTITYDGNSSTSGSLPSSQTKSYGISLTLVNTQGDLLRTGYTFNGWNDAENGSGTSYSVSGSYTANAAATLFAQWTLNTYTITYDGNSSTSGSLPSSQTKSYGISLTLVNTQGDLLRTGYTFNGWNDAENGSGTSYSVSGSYTANAAATLFAKWIANTNNGVSYNNQGATTAQSGGSTTYTTSASISTIPTTAPLKTGYTFNGWFTASSGGSQVSDGSYTPLSPYGSVTLYAQWSANTNNGVSYNNQGATTAQIGGSTTYTTAASISTIPTTAPLKTGYAFIGWFTASSGGSQVSDGSYTPLSPFGTVILYAQWTLNTYAVSYNGNSSTSGSLPSNQTKSYEINLTLVNDQGNLLRTNYTFNGWNTAANGSGTSYALGATYTANAPETLYAQWLGNNQSITYASGSLSATGSAPASPTTVRYAATFTTPTNTFIRTGYSFNGWSDGTSVYAANVTYPSSGTVSGLVTLTATWTANAFDITVTQGLNGTISPSTSTLDYGSNQTFTITPDTGYSISTVTIDDVSNPVSAAAGSHTFSNILATHTITASFSAISYTITYNSGANGAGGPLTQSFTFGNTATLKSATAAITRTGYSISGWTTSDGTSQSHALSATYSSAADLDLYPVWSANTLTVSFNSQTGSAITNGSTTTGGSVTDPGNPTLSRHTFSGWFSASSGGSRITFPYVHSQTSNFILYAQWSQNLQATLTLTSVNGIVGTALLLTKSGGSGGGQVTFAVSGTGCTIATDPVVTLSATAAGVCTVTVTQDVDATYYATSSVPTAVTFLAYSITSGSGATCPDNATSGTKISISSCQSVTTPTLVAPKITSLSTNSGRVADQITITGTNLAGATLVKFGGVSATILSKTETTAVVVVPTGAITGRVILSTPGGTSIGPTFTVNP